MSDYGKFNSPHSEAQQSASNQSTELEQTIQALRTTIYEISTTLGFIVNRVLLPEPQPPEGKGSGTALVATTYQQKLEELQIFSGRVLDTVRRLNGRI